MSTNTTPSSGSGRGNGTAAVVLGILVVAAIAVFVFLQFRGDDEPDVVETSPTPTATQTPTSMPSAPVAPSQSTGGIEVHDGPPIDNPFEGEEGITEVDVEVGERINDKPPYIDGTPYAGTSQGMQEWAPIRTQFTNGILTDGNIYEATKGTASPALEEKLKALPDGAYSDFEYAIDEDHHHPVYLDIQPFSYAETIESTDGRYMSVAVEYIYDAAAGVGEWKVTVFDVQ